MNTKAKAPICIPDTLDVSGHARKRMSQRGVSEQAIALALLVGRKIHSRRTLFHVIGRKEINLYKKQFPELCQFDGIHVITDDHCGSIITVYRNSDLRHIRPSKRKHRHLH
jgi:hypothetical protein